MRALILLAAIVILLALVGWITFSSDGDRSSINLETEEIRQDTGEMMHKGSELLQDAEQEIDPAPDAAPDENPAPATRP